MIEENYLGALVYDKAFTELGLVIEGDHPTYSIYWHVTKQISTAGRFYIKRHLVAHGPYTKGSE